MATSRLRWEGDERGHGIADGSAHAADIRRLLEEIASPGWVAEDPDDHLLPKLRVACREVALAWEREDACIGRLRADAYALIGEVTEDSTHVRQCATGREIRYDVTTGMLDGGSGFAGHGHLLRLIVRGDAANTIARSK